MSNVRNPVTGSEGMNVENIVLPDESNLRSRLQEATPINAHLAERVTPKLVAELQGETKHPFGVVTSVVLSIEEYRQETGLPAAIEPALMSNVYPLLQALAGNDDEEQQLTAAWNQVQQSR